MEKPVGFRSTAVGDLCGLAKSRGRVLMAGHVLLYHPAFVVLQEQRTRGSIGSLRSFHSIRENQTGGPVENLSPLWSLAPHDVALALELFGETPRHIQAQRGQGDAVTVHLGFSDKREAVIRVARSLPGAKARTTSWRLIRGVGLARVVVQTFVALVPPGQDKPVRLYGTAFGVFHGRTASTRGPPLFAEHRHARNPIVRPRSFAERYPCVGSGSREPGPVGTTDGTTSFTSLKPPPFPFDPMPATPVPPGVSARPAAAKE